MVTRDGAGGPRERNGGRKWWCHGCNDVAVAGHVCKDPALRHDGDPPGVGYQPLPPAVWGCIVVALTALAVDVDVQSDTVTLLLNGALGLLAYKAMRAIYAIGYTDGARGRQDRR